MALAIYKPPSCVIMVLLCAPCDKLTPFGERKGKISRRLATLHGAQDGLCQFSGKIRGEAHVYNSNLYPSSHCFQDYRSNFGADTRHGMPVFNALVRSEPIHAKFGVSKLETSLYRSEKYFNISSCLGVDHECDIQNGSWMDRQMDGRTDRQTFR